MSEIKLLALDLDGTLFTKDKQVTAENRAALKAAEAKGVHVVITTGRPLPAITHILEDLGFTIFVKSWGVRLQMSLLLVIISMIWRC